MEKSLLLVLITNVMLIMGCSKDTGAAPAESLAGIVKGRVVDSKGDPIANAKVVIEHTVLYAKYVYAVTDANGNYKTNVPEGSWHASVQIQKKFLDREYNFELSPDVDAAFAGSAGAVRNFSWKLSGAKPGGGFYGSYVAVYNEPGSSFDMTDVEVTLKPNGPLVDGSMGMTITKKLTDIGGGQEGINDVPIGMYNITARNTTTGQALQIRIRNNGAYDNSVTSFFDTWFTGVNTYQIAVQVKE
ncbi:MAG: carboxypeptidase-like regulatory domain-containing protein [Chitinophagaceae bacterium]